MRMTAANVLLPRQRFECLNVSFLVFFLLNYSAHEMQMLACQTRQRRLRAHHAGCRFQRQRRLFPEVAAVTSPLTFAPDSSAAGIAAVTFNLYVTSGGSLRRDLCIEWPRRFVPLKNPSHNNWERAHMSGLCFSPASSQ